MSVGVTFITCPAAQVMVRSCSLDILLMPANRQNQMRDLDKTQHQQNW
jgi:hypothetical protein